MIKNFRIIIEGTSSTLKGYSLFTKAMHQMVEQRNTLIADEWGTLEELANQGLGQAYGAYREIRRSVGTLHTAKVEANSGLAKILGMQAGIKETREEFFTAFKDELLKLNPNTSQKLLDGLMEMGQGKSKGTAVEELFKTTETNAVEYADMRKAQWK